MDRRILTLYNVVVTGRQARGHTLAYIDIRKVLGTLLTAPTKVKDSEKPSKKTKIIKSWSFIPLHPRH